MTAAFQAARDMVDDILPKGRWVAVDELDDLAGMKGAYILLIRLDESLPIGAGRRKTGHLASGVYLYSGSANGAGGLSARLRRHFRKEKKVHWHIDRLTLEAGDLAAFIVEHGNECQLVQALMQADGIKAALDGFGSTDCRSCRSHLLMPG